MPGKNRPSRRAYSDRRMAAYIEAKEKAKEQQVEAVGGEGGEGGEEEEFCFCGGVMDWPRA